MAPDGRRPRDADGTPLSGAGHQTTLMALGTAMVLSIYSAGFLRTRAAATRIAAESDVRRAPSSSAPSPHADAQRDTATALPPAGRDTSAAAVVAPPLTRTAQQPRPSTFVDGAAVLPIDSAPARAPVVTAPTVPEPVPAPVTTSPVDTVQHAAADTAHAGYRDGTYSGWGTSRHGDIEATVEIRGGRIVSADISQCRTRYSCSRIAQLPPQVLARQTPEVDHVSGATQSSDAYYYAVAEALKKAK